MSEKIYTAADSMLVQQQAEIERLKAQRDKLIRYIKAEGLQGVNTKQLADALIAEIETTS